MATRQGNSWLNEYVDLFAVLKTAYGIESFAATNLIAHGHVKIDGFTVPLPWAKGHWRKRQVVGKMLSCPRGQIRLYGSASATHEIINQQLKLTRNA